MGKHGRWRLYLFQQDCKCFWCGFELTYNKSTLDHVLPKSLSKAFDKKENCVISCQECNHYRGELHAQKRPNLFHPNLNEVQLQKVKPIMLKYANEFLHS